MPGSLRGDCSPGAAPRLSPGGVAASPSLLSLLPLRWIPPLPLAAVAAAEAPVGEVDPAAVPPFDGVDPP